MMTDLTKFVGTECDNGACHQFLTFTLDGEEYGLEILRVQEIKGLPKIRPIPNAPSYVKGVMNLRGSVVPVMDLRARFGLPATDPNPFTVVIVIGVGSRLIGLIVDTVSDVLTIEDDAIEDTTDLTDATHAHLFLGLSRFGERMVLLLNVEQLMPSARVESLEPVMLGVPQ